MSVIVVDDGSLRSLNLIGQSWPGVRSIGLYGNTPSLSRHTTIANIVPCAWSGYSGLKTLPAFGAAAMQGDLAVASTPRLTWTYDGGYPTGYSVGYYVQDSDGALLWAEEFPLPVAMVATGQDIYVVATLSAVTRYGDIP